jgi:quinol monooxygenase YgiN
MTTWDFKKGKREEGFLELDNILNTTVRATSGFRGYMSLLPHETPNKAVILTLWQDEDSMETSTKGVDDATKKIRALLKAPPKIENFRVFSTELFQKS